MTVKITNNNDFKYISNEFINMYWNFYASNLSIRTRTEYERVITQYSKITKTDLLNTNPDAVQVYFKYIEERLKSNRLSYNTAVMRFSVLRTVSEYIKYKKEKEGHSFVNYFKDIVLPDSDKTLVNEDIPSDSDLDYILNAAFEANDDQAFLLFSLVIKCGLKSSEISKLDIDYLAIDANDNFCIAFPGKTKLSRIIKLPDDISNLLNSYIDKNKITDGPVFINKRNNRLKVRDAERILNKYIEEGINKKKISKHFTLQSMRHAAFKYMLQGNASEEDVANYCGITTKWMSRYKRVVSTTQEFTAGDYSVIKITKNDKSKNKI